SSVGSIERDQLSLLVSGLGSRLLRFRPMRWRRRLGEPVGEQPNADGVRLRAVVVKEGVVVWKEKERPGCAKKGRRVRDVRRQNPAILEPDTQLLPLGHGLSH